jgi:tetratricopeptide (TPR) repeat protein
LLALAEVAGRTPTERRIRELQRRLRVQPTWEDGYLLLGRAWVRKAREAADPGFYLHAEACAKVLLERSAEHAGALNLRGIVRLNQHEFRAAKELAESVLRRDAEDVMAWGTLSDAELELGNFDAAVSAVDRMLGIKPGLPAYSRSSYLRFLRGDTNGALQAIRLAIDAGLDPADAEPLAWTLVQAARLFWHRGDYAGADAGYEQALAVAPDYAPALVERGRVALALGNPARAVELLRRAERKSPQVDTLWLLGDALREAGDQRAATDAYARAEREGLRGDRRALSLMDSTRNVNVKRALELARAEHALRRDVYTEDALAWALHRNGEVAAARASSERATRLGTPDALLLFHRGAILLASGQTQEGRAWLEKALRQNPKFDRDGAREAAALLGKAPS